MNQLLSATCWVGALVLAQGSRANAPEISMPAANQDLIRMGPAHPAPLTADDKKYLARLAKDTWANIADLGNSKSGLPYDNSDKGEFTSVSNIGIYLTCVAAAHRMKLIDQDQTDQRLGRALSSLESLKTWFGFQQSWNSVETLQPAKHDPWISILDSGNLAAGLLSVAQAEPKFKTRCRKLFESMQWSKFYDVAQSALIGGYNSETGEFNKKWHLDLLASDALLAQFFAVAAGNMPADRWNSFSRATETRCGVEYLAPGWQGGGLFMQCIAALWLDNAGTIVGNSASNFAWAQIQYAKQIGAPVWGWSACDDPAGGYLGWGGLKDEVVTPHASALALDFWPHEAAANLRALEALGSRSASFGFYDSFDWKNKRRSGHFLVLDQGMLFLSLANALDKNVVRSWMQASPIVKRGRREIQVYRDAAR